MSEADKKTGQTTETKQESTTKTFSEADVNALLKPLQDQIASLNETVKGLKSTTDNIPAESRKSEIRSFCDQMVTAGKMSPADRLTEEAMLTELASVAAFGETQSKLITDRKAAIMARKPFLFGEFDKSGEAATDRTAKAKGIVGQAVAQFSESNLGRITSAVTFKVQSLRDAGYTETEIQNLPKELISESELKEAGITK